MHEASIALSLLEIAAGECNKSGYGRIDSINVKVGRASGVMPDALLFAFDAIKEGSIARNAVLQIEEVPVSGRCSDCRKEFTVDQEYVLSCPLCGGGSFTITAGREMDIIDMEVS
ncbi:MAG: hydrogenase maturation nickel metallochaperone HypA [Candidatus Sulfobium sp.]|jgi:hydrogenase nickel incorporation protein HypA/HybF